MIENIEKPKVRKGLSYVLKTSELAEALENAGIDCHVSLYYWTPQRGDSILQGFYWLPRKEIPYPRLYVRAGTVPSQLRAKAAEWLIGMALPQFIRWIETVVALPDNSTLLDGDIHFDAVWSESDVGIHAQPQFKICK